MPPDAATAAKHPAVAEFLIERVQAGNAALRTSLCDPLARPEPPPELVRARLGCLPIYSEDCSKAI
ncbi:hypothetical protein CLV01_3335 [Delftia sp. 60]|nr:hypothetical protein CLU98_3114 [Burkholderiales bacterium 23]PIF66933.1 hypothetical protein CLV01_3335 [Delftia sp. 60]